MARAKRGDFEMKNHTLLASVIVLLTATSSAVIADRASGPVVVPTGPLTMPSLTQGERDKLIGPCRMDLSVESIDMRKSGTTGPISASMVIKNLGTEAFSAPASFTGAVFEATHGGTNRVTTFPAGDISIVRPGDTRRFSITMPRTVFDSLEFSGELRGYINFGPDAPRCGRDPNPANDELRMSNEQVRAWLYGTAPTVIVRR